MYVEIRSQTTLLSTDMAYIYNPETGNFENLPDKKPSSGGSSGTDPDSGKVKKWLKIAGGIAATALSVILVATTGENYFHND